MTAAEDIPVTHSLTNLAKIMILPVNMLDFDDSVDLGPDNILYINDYHFYLLLLTYS